MGSRFALDSRPACSALPASIALRVGGIVHAETYHGLNIHGARMTARPVTTTDLWKLAGLVLVLIDHWGLLFAEHRPTLVPQQVGSRGRNV
jgi:hypothetical protein